MPTVLDSTKFLTLVQKSGLVSADQLNSMYNSEDEIPASPDDCAKEMVQAKLLTSFQAKQLLGGRYRGFMLGTYKILEPIGKGGMGTVFLGEHSTLKRQVALKVLPADKAKDNLILERFYREARAAAALDHANIVRLHDISQGNGVHFLVMEYVNGVDLHSLMGKTGPLHYAQAAQYVAQAAAGLAHAHECGFVHRDIKPSNLILSKAGIVKILDMGLARSFANKDDNLTAQLGDSSEVAGTADYISPEQALNRPIDERSDIYSLGSTLYSLIAGHPPFRGTTAQKLMQHQVAEPPSLSKLRGIVPPALIDVCQKMMAKKPSDRYDSAMDVIDALSPWLPAPSTGNVTHDLVAANGVSQSMRMGGSFAYLNLPGTDEPKKNRKPMVVIGAVALAVVLAVIVGMFAVMGGDKEPTELAPPTLLQQAPVVTPPENTAPTVAPQTSFKINKTQPNRASTGLTLDFANTPTGKLTQKHTPANNVYEVVAQEGGFAIPNGGAAYAWGANIVEPSIFTVACAVEDGQKHLSLYRETGSHNLEMSIPVTTFKLEARTVYEWSVTYRMNQNCAGQIELRYADRNWERIPHIQKLKPTRTEWKTISVTFTAGESYQPCITFQSDPMSNSNSAFDIRSITIRPINVLRSSSKPTHSGTSLLTLNDQQEAVIRFEGDMPDVSKSPLKQWFGKSESAIDNCELLIERRDAAMALGIRGIEGNPRCILVRNDLQLKIDGEHRVKFSYMLNGSAPAVEVCTRKSPDDFAIYQAIVEPTAGAWKQAEVTIPANAIGPEMTLEFHHSDPNGPGNEFFLKDVTIE